MNRRSFMKVLGGALAGVLALPSKAKYIFGKYDPKMANIDSSSEWAKPRFDKSILDLPNETLNRMERLRIEAAHKAVNLPYVIEWGTDGFYILDEKTRT